MHNIVKIALTVAFCFPPADYVIAAAETKPCALSSADTNLSAARADAHGRNWRQAQTEAAVAAKQFNRCAAVSTGQDYAYALYQEGSAQTIVALAIESAGGSKSSPEMRRAYALFRWVAKSKEASAQLRRLASAKALEIASESEDLARTLSYSFIPKPAQSLAATAAPAATPETMTTPSDSARANVPAFSTTAKPTAIATVAVPAATTPAPAPLPAIVTSPTALATIAPLTPAPTTLAVQVVDAWTSQFTDGRLFQHVRVHLSASKNVLIRSQAFRMTATGPYGHETVYGYPAPAPSYQKPNYIPAQGQPASTLVALVNPLEDLGREPTQLRAGDSITTVITFLMKPNTTFDRSDASALTWTEEP